MLCQETEEVGQDVAFFRSLIGFFIFILKILLVPPLFLGLLLIADWLERDYWATFPSQSPPAAYLPDGATPISFVVEGPWPYFAIDGPGYLLTAEMDQRQMAELLARLDGIGATEIPTIPGEERCIKPGRDAWPGNGSDMAVCYSRQTTCSGYYGPGGRSFPIAEKPVCHTLSSRIERRAYVNDRARFKDSISWRDGVLSWHYMGF